MKNEPQTPRQNHHPRSHVHVPPEFGRHAPDLPGYLPHGKMVDHLSSIEHWLIGIILVGTLGIQFWQMTH